MSSLINEDFNHTIDYWIKELDQYNFDRLCTKPADNSWSAGQVYVHLIENTTYFFEQIKVCLSSNGNANEEMSPVAKTMFLNNEFPDLVIEGPASNGYTQQPVSKEQLMSDLLQLKDDVNTIAMLISKSSAKGKTKHEGLQYFNANEWFRFAEMHFRHHTRQKKRIDDFLKGSSHMQ